MRARAGGSSARSPDSGDLEQGLSTATPAAPPEPGLEPSTDTAGAVSHDTPRGPAKDPARGGEVPPSLFERFEGFELVGRGGMGAVYRAHDSRLHRSVAIKLISAGSAPHGGFLHEARAQARVLHPNVCEVHEAGIADGVPFIVMRYVDGAPLHKLDQELSIEEKARLVRLVALALHEAHREGLVHRDVKPGNVLVERAKDGSLRPYIADFGIARDLTRAPPGAAQGPAGTPAYMAPEQLQPGAPLDRRTDVYGLGATLYTALTGASPPPARERISSHSSSSSGRAASRSSSDPEAAASLDPGHPAVASGANGRANAPSAQDSAVAAAREPPSPRAIVRSIPRDLDAIVRKCLSRSPDLRYESAKALAEDLQRFLDGDPVLARPRSAIVRLIKRARRHKAFVTLAAVALVVVTGLLGAWLRSLRIAAQREALARDLGGSVREMELFMRGAHLLPLHDLADERAHLRESLAAVEARIREAGDVGIGPGHDALGRGHLALQDAETALAHFEAAEAAGHRAPGFEHAMGLALVEVYRRELEKASRLPSEADKAARVEQIQRLYRDRAIAHLRAAVTQGVESPAYALGLIAYHEGRFEDALREAAEASSRAPWLYEAHRLAGSAEYAIGSRTRYDRADFDHARTMEHFRRAAAEYRRAAEIARSDPSVHEAECELWIQIAGAAFGHDDPIRPPFEEAKSACERAIAASPGSATSHLRLAVAHQQFSWWLVWRDDPNDPADRALEEATSRVEAAAALAPRDAYASWLVGAVWRNAVYFQRSRARDAKAALDRSIAGYEAAVALDPAFLWALKEGCEMLAMRAQRDAVQGLDAAPSLALARARCARAREIDPSLGGLAYVTLFVHAVDAERLVEAGESPTPAVTEGLRAAEALEAKSPGDPSIAAFRAELLRREAEVEIRKGGDPTSALARAQEQVSRLPSSFLAGDAAAPLALTTAESHLARLLQEPAPRAPVPDLEKALSRAVEGYRASLRERPHDLSATAWRAGLVRAALAGLRYRMALGGALQRDAETALALVAEVPDDPGQSDPRLDLAVAEVQEAIVELRDGMRLDPTGPLTAALARAERAVAAGPGLFVARATLGRLLVRQARSIADPAKKKEIARRAAAELGRVKGRSPVLGASLAVWLGEARGLSGDP